MDPLTHIPHTLPELEACIGQIEQYLSDLKARRNQAASPLCRIPDELVVKILQHAQDDLVLEQAHGPMNWWGRHLSICRHIWCIAQTSPELWSFTQVGYNNLETSMRHFELCETHRGDHPIALQAFFGPSIEIADLISQHAARIHALDLRSHITRDQRAPWKNKHIYLSLLARNEWPMLQRAIVQSYYVGHSCPIHPELFKGASNTLTYLHLKDDWVLKAAPDLPSLQTLNINSLAVSNFTQLRTWLAAIPDLVSLGIEFGNLNDKDEAAVPSSDQSAVLLPHLNFVHLCGHPEQLMCTLPLLPDPHDELCIHSRCRRGEHSNTQQPVLAWAMAYLARQRHTSGSPACEYRLELVSDIDRDSDPRFWLKPVLPLHVNGHGPPPHGRLCFGGQHADTEIMRELTRIARTVDFTSTGLLSLVRDALLLPESIVENLSFAEWSSYWLNTAAINFVGGCLKRKARENGRGIKALRVDERDREMLKNIEHSLRDRGWIQELVAGVKVTFEDCRGGLDK